MQKNLLFQSLVLTQIGVLRILWTLQRRSMSSDQMFPQIPLVLDHFVTNVAIDSLRLNVHIDNVLLEVEAVWEGFPAVVAEPGLHAAPPLPGVSHRGVVVGGHDPRRPALLAHGLKPHPLLRQVAVKASVWSWQERKYFNDFHINIYSGAKRWILLQTIKYLSNGNCNMFSKSQLRIYWRRKNSTVKNVWFRFENNVNTFYVLLNCQMEIKSTRAHVKSIGVFTQLDIGFEE